MQRVDVVIPQAFLVAGYSARPGSNDEPVLQERYDWQAIRGHVRDLYFLNSVTDEYGCDAAQGRAMLDQLGGTLIVRDDGHFTSGTLPLVERLIY